MTVAEYLRAARILTQGEVDHRAFVRGLADPAPGDVAEAHALHAEYGSAER
ncbi:hypothetical protein [Streptomyces sp. NRRL S-920]|uniref:hypothetical protein n=1 Tax=Streptomyces sp. NRRL S-920 TaxID=1463921 RepID=UPI000ABF7CDA|nr:hypothetical protein [Streptomyces sp. NRRL S-920]